MSAPKAEYLAGLEKLDEAEHFLSIAKELFNNSESEMSLVIDYLQKGQDYLKDGIDILKRNCKEEAV